MAAEEVANIERPNDPVHKKKFMVKQVSKKRVLEKRCSAEHVPLE